MFLYLYLPLLFFKNKQITKKKKKSDLATSSKNMSIEHVYPSFQLL